jgi:hypothetical protein
MASTDDLTPEQQRRVRIGGVFASSPLAAYLGTKLALSINETYAALITPFAVTVILGVFYGIVFAMVRGATTRPEWRGNVALAFVGVLVIGLVLLIPHLIGYF